MFGFDPGTIRLFQEGGILSEFYQFVPTIAAKGHVLCYHVYVIMHVKDP